MHRDNESNACHWPSLTDVSAPAQGFVLPEHPAHSVPVVGQHHCPGGAETLLVVPHERPVANRSTWGTEIWGRSACKDNNTHIFVQTPPVVHRIL